MSTFNKVSSRFCRFLSSDAYTLSLDCLPVGPVHLSGPVSTPVWIRPGQQSGGAESALSMGDADPLSQAHDGLSEPPNRGAKSRPPDRIRSSLGDRRIRNAESQVLAKAGGQTAERKGSAGLCDRGAAVDL